jgi:hypothetical protein
MKKLLSAALAAIGLGSSAQAAPQVETIDPSKLRYSMPTVAADDIQYIRPTAQSFEGAPQFHEDEWRQLEFYPASRLPELQTRLREYKVFEQQNRTPHGWNKIYARRMTGPAVLPAAAISAVAELLKARVQPSPILTTASRPLGQVKDGFTLRVADTVFLYGTASGSAISSLAALVGSGGDDQSLTQAFSRLYISHKLVLVDWRSQMVLTSVGSDGRISVWRP